MPAVVDPGNRLPVITAGGIRDAVTDVELQTGLASTAPAPVVPADAKLDFVNRLMDRRGAYRWRSGTETADGKSDTAFRTWIEGQPLDRPMPHISS